MKGRLLLRERSWAKVRILLLQWSRACVRKQGATKGGASLRCGGGSFLREIRFLRASRDLRFLQSWIRGEIREIRGNQKATRKVQP
jgi:hypothetical protein